MMQLLIILIVSIAMLIGMYGLEYWYVTHKRKRYVDCGDGRSVETSEAIMERVNEHRRILERKGYEVAFIALQGSQNYGLDEYSEDYMSDVDTKAIVLPHFEDFVYGKQPISTTLILDNEEHIDVKDIRIMFDMFKKENISYIELLYSKYQWFNPKYEKMLRYIVDYRDAITAAHIAQFAKCIAGMSMEKKKALCHPYPGIAAKIEKYGFDGKQLSHCVRLNEFIDKFYNGVPVESCFESSRREELMNYKKNLTKDGSKIMTVEEAIELCDVADRATAAAKNDIVRIYEGNVDDVTFKMLDNIKYNVLKKKFIEDLGGRYEKEKY